MRFLYVVFILSTAALLWAAYAIARTVRRHGREAQGSTLSLRLDPRAEEHDSEHPAEIEEHSEENGRGSD